MYIRFVLHTNIVILFVIYIQDSLVEDLLISLRFLISSMFWPRILARNSLISETESGKSRMLLVFLKSGNILLISILFNNSGCDAFSSATVNLAAASTAIECTRFSLVNSGHLKIVLYKL